MKRNRTLTQRVEQLERLVGGVNIPEAIAELMKR